MRLLFPVIPAILLVGLVLPGLDDKAISVADTSIANDEVASISKAGNSSASDTITITMYTVCDE